jgi:hypothetical protein
MKLYLVCTVLHKSHSSNTIFSEFESGCLRCSPRLTIFSIQHCCLPQLKFTSLHANHSHIRQQLSLKQLIFFNFNFALKYSCSLEASYSDDGPVFIANSIQRYVNKSIIWQSRVTRSLIKICSTGFNYAEIRPAAVNFNSR